MISVYLLLDSNAKSRWHSGLLLLHPKFNNTSHYVARVTGQYKDNYSSMNIRHGLYLFGLMRNSSSSIPIFDIASEEELDDF